MKRLAQRRRSSAPARLLPLVEDTGWFFDTELLVIAEKCGYRVHEEPVRWTEDADSRVRVAATVWADLAGMVRVRRKLARGAYREAVGAGGRESLRESRSGGRI